MLNRLVNVVGRLAANVFLLAVRWGNRSTKLSIYYRSLIEKLHLGLTHNPHLRQTNVVRSVFIMSKKITIEIEVSNIDRWDVNWENESDKKEQLERLQMEVKTVLADNVGIHWDSLKIVKCEVSC